MLKFPKCKKIAKVVFTILILSSLSPLLPTYFLNDREWAKYITERKVFMKYSSALLLLSVSLAIVLPALDNVQAEGGDQPNCDISCPSDEKVVSFTDGDNVACVCSPVTQMVPTEPDPSVVNSGEYQDEGQKE